MSGNTKQRRKARRSHLRFVFRAEKASREFFYGIDAMPGRRLVGITIDAQPLSFEEAFKYGLEVWAKSKGDDPR